MQLRCETATELATAVSSGRLALLSGYAKGLMPLSAWGMKASD
jgi:hypothetical protein